MQKTNIIYGYLAGIIAAATLQPLENIKVALLVPPKNLSLNGNFINNIAFASKYIAKDSGFMGFYKGIVPNVIKTGFGSAIFFGSLRFIQKKFDDPNSTKAAFISSFTGRIISAITSNPLSVLETRYQLAGTERWSGSLAKNILRIYQYEGIRGYFKGCSANCYKQGIFAGLYYSLYTEGKKFQIPATVSGILSGVISTFLTHPFQIIRAQSQANVLKQSGDVKSMQVLRQFRQLLRTGQALRGVAPRLVKKPLSNTIAFLFFEFMEQCPDISTNKQ